MSSQNPLVHLAASVSSTIYNFLSTPFYVAGITSYTFLKGLIKIPERLSKIDEKGNKDFFIFFAVIPPAWPIFILYFAATSIIFPALNATFDTVKYQISIVEKLFFGLDTDQPGATVENPEINLNFFLGRDTGYGRDAMKHILNELKEERQKQNVEQGPSL